MARCVLATALILSLGCSGPPLIIDETVEVERLTIRGSGRPLSPRGRDPRHLAIELTLLNRTGADLVLEAIEATVFDAARQLEAPRTLGGETPLKVDETATFEVVMRGDWPETAVLILATRVRTVDGTIQTSVRCRPLCDACGDLDAACVTALVARARPGSGA